MTHQDVFLAVLGLLAMASSGLAVWNVLPAGPGVWRVHVRGRDPVDVRVSRGAIEAVASEDDHAFLWRVPEPQRPDFAVVAAFARGRLRGWRAIPLTAVRIQEVDASPGASVEVVVAGRRYAGVAGLDGVARVRVDVPPGVHHAEILGNNRRVTHDLEPPPVTTAHFLSDESGALWCFTIDEQGSPADRLEDGEGGRVAPGVHLYGRPSPLAFPSVESMTGPSRALDVRRPWELRAGAALGQGREVKRAFAAFAGASSPFVIGATAAVMFSGVRRERPDRSGSVLNDALAFMAWLEAPVTQQLGPVRVGATPALGGAFVLHATKPSFAPHASWREYGPSAGGALRVGVGPAELEARAIWSTARLRTEESLFGGWLALAGRLAL